MKKDVPPLYRMVQVCWIFMDGPLALGPLQSVAVLWLSIGLADAHVIGIDYL